MKHLPNDLFLVLGRKLGRARRHTDKVSLPTSYHKFVAKIQKQRIEDCFVIQGKRTLSNTVEIGAGCSCAGCY